jgi:membrane fusion protein (multidrug efflux system)
MKSAIAKAARSGTAALLALLGLAALPSDHAEAGETAKTSEPIPAVLVQPAQLKSLSREFEFIGRVQAREKVELRARVKGFLGPRLFDDGSQVKEGQILFTIEREPFEAAVAQKKAQLASAEASLEFANQQVARATELSKSNSGAITQVTIDERLADQSKARAAVLEAKAALTEAEINLSYADIKSPIAGRVGRATVSPGNLVSPETGVLATVVTEDPVEVLFPVTQRELLDYRRRSDKSGKHSTRVKLADGTIYEEAGVVDFLDVQVDPRTDGQIVRAMMPNPKKILTDGQTVRVVLVEEATEEVLTIPRAAIVIDQAGAYVFIVNDRNVIEQRRVKMGPEKDGLVTITEGLAENEMVVVQGLQRVRAGITVSAQRLQTPAGAPEASK